MVFAKKVVYENGEKKHTEDVEVDTFSALAEEERDHDIKYRTLSWQKCAALLFGEYVCLAILALSWSFSVVGWTAGILITFGLGMITWYTSYLLWEFCMAHPEARDICDIAAILFPRVPRLAFEATGVMLLLNNIFLIGFHVFTGAKIFNTLSDSALCTVSFQVITAVIGIIVSLPRTLKHVSLMSIVSAGAMGIALLLTLIFAGIEDAPYYGYNGYYPTDGPVKTYAGVPGGSATFVNALNAVLNITYLWVGQILYPSFIAEMRRPQDFPKALAALTIAELILFLVCAIVPYYYIGQYSTAPIIGSLSVDSHKKAAFAFVLIPTLVIGAIYANVAGKFVFKRILGNTRHAHSHSIVGWGTWIGIIVAIWAVAFVLGNVIPSMGDFLSILSSAFDSFYGFIYPCYGGIVLNRGRLFDGPRRTAHTILQLVLIGVGFFMLGPGLYTSVKAITIDYAGAVRHPFSCASNAL